MKTLEEYADALHLRMNYSRYAENDKIICQVSVGGITGEGSNYDEAYAACLMQVHDQHKYVVELNDYAREHGLEKPVVDFDDANYVFEVDGRFGKGETRELAAENCLRKLNHRDFSDDNYSFLEKHALDLDLNLSVRYLPQSPLFIKEVRQTWAAIMDQCIGYGVSREKAINACAMNVRGDIEDPHIISLLETAIKDKIFIMANFHENKWVVVLQRNGIGYAHERDFQLNIACRDCHDHYDSGMESRVKIDEFGNHSFILWYSGDAVADMESVEGIARVVSHDAKNKFFVMVDARYDLKQVMRKVKNTLLIACGAKQW